MPGVAQRVGRGIALLFHDRETRMWVSGRQEFLAALYPREIAGTHFTRGWVGPQDRSGNSLGNTFLAFKKRITDRISQSAAPSIVLKMFNAQEQT